MSHGRVNFLNESHRARTYLDSACEIDQYYRPLSTVARLGGRTHDLRNSFVRCVRLVRLAQTQEPTVPGSNPTQFTPRPLGSPDRPHLGDPTGYCHINSVGGRVSWRIINYTVPPALARTGRKTLSRRTAVKRGIESGKLYEFF
jgi:hypothetical protein